MAFALLVEKDNVAWFGLRQSHTTSSWAAACRDAMVGVGHGFGCGRAQTPMMPPSAALVLFQEFVRIGDGQTEHDVELPSNTNSVLSQAVREACVEGTVRIPTNFPADQIRLWAAYTRCPCVFRTQSSLLNIFATLEVRLSSDVHHGRCSPGRPAPPMPGRRRSSAPRPPCLISLHTQRVI